MNKKLMTFICMVFVLMLAENIHAAGINVDIQGDYFGIYPPVKQDEYMSVKVKIRSDTRMTGFKCELGFYGKIQVEQWGYLAISGDGIYDVPNCVAYETNVDSVLVHELEPGVTKEITYQIRAPHGDPDKDYVLFSECFSECYNVVGSDMVVYGWNKVNIDLKDIGVFLEDCSDGILNQDETDTDCGGRCKSCGIGLKCIDDDDCSSDYCEPNQKRCRECVPDWECNEWSGCQDDGYQYRSCTDNRYCGTASDNPNSKLCNAEDPSGKPGMSSSAVIFIAVSVLVLIVIIGIFILNKK